MAKLMVYEMQKIIRNFKALINSKKLFRNWLSAGIRYYLIKRGLVKSDSIIVKICDRVIGLKPEVYEFLVSICNNEGLKKISRVNEGFFSKLWGVVDLMILKDGKTLLKMPDGVLLSLEEFYDPIVLVETWLYEIHFLGFDLSDWLVIDIGAYVGDSALYYAKRGALVIAVEPLPRNYEIMVKNLELNPDIKNRIITINAAIGHEGFTEITYGRFVDGGASIYGDGKFSTKVRSMSLSSLIKEITSMGIDLDKFKVKVLKMDCKGCEYDIIHEVEILKLFDIIKIEYSGYLRGKDYHELKKVLEDLGFKCRVWAHNEYAPKIGLDKHGTLTCIKKYNEMIR
jgi:FkbM family methyltransferase